jgi:hypothetical protein
VTLRPVPGGAAAVELVRDNVAERLYRVTGAGIYRDSVLLGARAPIARPLLAGGVVGQDTTQTAIFGGRVFWIWGDTSRASYPLGNFHAAGAVSELPSRGGLDPERGVDLRYFEAADGFAKEMARPAKPSAGPTWLFSLIALPDGRGRETLLARYNKIRGASMESYEEGIVRFDEARATFEEVAVATPEDPVRPGSHPYVWRRPGAAHVHFSEPVRVPAEAEAYTRLARYEAFTPLAGGAGPVDRGPDGAIRYAWRRAIRGASPDDVQAGRLAPAEALFGHVRDIATGKPVTEHADSVAPNPYRGRFVRLLSERFGSSSTLGEIFFLEADTPVGPWVYARKVITHDRYTFYNPRHHPFFDKHGGRVIFLEGTYTVTFSGNTEPTPRYDYNQIMYRLDLADPRLALPVPVYDLASGGPPGDFATKRALRPGAPAPRASFFAPDRPGPGLVPIAWDGPACARRRLVASATPPSRPLFFAVPTGAAAKPPGVVPLAAFAAPDGRRAYAPAGDRPPGGFVAEASPLAFVWPNPLAARLPVEEYLEPLVADAGPDQCVPQAGGRATVALDGSRSRHEAGAIAAYAWRWGEGPAARTASGPRPRIELGPGLHRVTLEVTGPDGARADDEVLVLVGR